MELAVSGAIDATSEAALSSPSRRPQKAQMKKTSTKGKYQKI
jgi:hypothetical protein